ncbi:hypothetical protein T07_2942 [Trichinella nelsoni]|uniref:Uncharacterized protein n=1 Tax=Trichinella nelsoni TaxID=6336 RepID=A0A0V0R9Z6_9BILA|nr:hypothetical protein T07_2942 [Trichinella nelsoni]
MPTVCETVVGRFQCSSNWNLSEILGGDVEESSSAMSNS